MGKESNTLLMGFLMGKMVSKIYNEHKTDEKTVPYINSCPKNILIAVVGVVILLAGMFVTALFSEELVNSFFNIIPLCVSMAVVIKLSKIDVLCGKRMVLGTAIVIGLIVCFNIWLSSNYIFDDYLNGYGTSLSNHKEHSLMYNEMATIASRLDSGSTLGEATRGLPLYQYYNIFVYSSFMFLLGGINPTNMCIWGAYHLFLCAFFVVLILSKFGVKNQKHLSFAFYVTLFQPLLMSVSTYNKVLVGEAIIMIALYIYITNYNDPWKNVLSLPIYAYLLWTVRLQYVAIAAVLFVICLVHNKAKKKVILPIAIGLFALTLLFLNSDLGKMLNSINVGYYTEGHDLSLGSIPARIIRSFIPYFPLTNLGEDSFWYFNLFCVFQEGMNIVLWGKQLFRKNKIDLTGLKKRFSNPLFWAAIVFLLGGTLSELHTTYLSVGTPLLLSSFEVDDNIRFIFQYFFVMLVLLVLSLVYIALGLSGSGFAGVSFG